MDGKTVCIGWGIVGKSTGYVLDIKDHFDIEDDKSFDDDFPPHNFYHADVFIICLPTPTVGGKQDLDVIERWLERIARYRSDSLVAIRSTFLPGTTKKFSKKYGLNIAHVPEFLSEATALEDAREPELLVIGADDILVREKVKDIFNLVNYKKLILTDSTTAELIKYVMNSWFALKVTFGNQLWDVAKETGADYNKVKEALEEHEWGSKNGWDVWHGGYRGFGGKCLPKDVEVFMNAFDLPLLEKMQEINRKLVKETLQYSG